MDKHGGTTCATHLLGGCTLMIDLDELERLALAATPGEWVRGRATGQCPIQSKEHSHGIGECDYRINGWHSGGPEISVYAPIGDPYSAAVNVIVSDDERSTPPAPDAGFIVAAQPTRVLQLIARIRELESALASANAHIDDLLARLSCLLDEHDSLALHHAEEALRIKEGG